MSGPGIVGRGVSLGSGCPARQREQLPLLPGALDVVHALRQRWPLGLASSSNREIIELFLELGELAGTFAATVSSEEVARGKPAPDVYLAAAEKMGADPAKSAAIEDSSNGCEPPCP